MKRRYCPAGRDEFGRPRFVPHDGNDGDAVILNGEMKSGEALGLGEGIARVELEADGHAVIDEIVAPGGGPPKVTSNAYRSGWDRAFGKHVN